VTAVTVAAPSSAPELAPRVGLLDGLRQSVTLAWRTIVQVRHNPWELTDFSIQPIMFVLLFTFVFGGAIAGDWQAYLQGMLPGMLVMNMLFVTLYVAQGLNTDVTKGVFDRLRSLPIARWAPLAGRIGADQVKQIWSIVLVLAVGLVMGFRLGNGVDGLLGAVVLLLVFALAFSWVAVLIGITAKDPERVQIYGFTALFPVTMVSNVFVPAETMPGWLQAFVNVNPVSILADAARYLMLGDRLVGTPWYVESATGPVLLSLAWAAGIALVFAPLSVRAFKRRV
jgi:oleandomycin transport system permease protein